MATIAMRIQLADEVLELPIPPGLAGYELIDGQLVEVMPAGLTHGHLAAEVAVRMRAYVKEQRIRGRVYVEAADVLGLARDPQRLRGPDVSFLRNEILQTPDGKPPAGFFHGAPDLAVEIASAERPKALQQRIHDYLDAGTRLVWVINSTAQSATAYRADGSARLLRETDALDGEDVLPGLRIPLSELFAD